MARPARHSGNLPAEATSFVGRRRELAEVRKKLTEARLVSLVGPGGVGKTRLAIRAATDLGRGFRDGAWLAELAEVSDPGLVERPARRREASPRSTVAPLFAPPKGLAVDVRRKGEALDDRGPDERASTP